jgi:hypothetical protein
VGLRSSLREYRPGPEYWDNYRFFARNQAEPQRDALIAKVQEIQRLLVPLLILKKTKL